MEYRQNNHHHNNKIVMSTEIKKICIVCNKDNSNYKCPKCKDK